MATSLALPSSKRTLDVLEQAIVLVLYIWLIARMWPSEFPPSNWYSFLILVSEGFVVALIVLRRRTERISTALRDWVVAFAGTFLVLLVRKGGAPIAADIGVFFMLIGLGVHVAAKLSLLRSFGLVAADRGIKVGGLYAIVRHPMYCGYILTHVGLLLNAPSVWNLAVYLAAWSLFIARIFAEERVLGANPAYRRYMGEVRYRLVPGLF